MPGLFDPLAMGELTLPNRILMAPLTRCRASAGRVPNAMMKEYYVQRASAGIIFSEATAVTPMGVGYPDTPGMPIARSGRAMSSARGVWLDCTPTSMTMPASAASTSAAIRCGRTRVLASSIV